ncbi:lactosylceramide 4-alpha-galactosyltransferase-like isoform X1 [Chiloscyllium plagiosum]|uniref:lactosylceramide 4-alpha-galactosyltransferase-like isoform X1 n=2 Tax=Chiloscyllium plagiosum TaxID=36176 RepID=UPI001CB7D85A|nr:lactosylceramide 4-alpha-galactosyltransferase-like isoform X1 [Chiloscyllium plagiosum]
MASCGHKVTMEESVLILKSWHKALVLILIISSIVYYYVFEFKPLKLKYPFPKKASRLAIRLSQSDAIREPGIMFVQTSNDVAPSPLAMCSIESAARQNRNKTIYFLMSGFNGNISAYREPEYKAISLLSSFENVIILPLNPKELFNNTPLAGWYEKVDPNLEQYWFHVLSDGCRIALLWKFGGIYLDTDIISIKPLEFQNFICAQSSNYANGAALGFNRSHSFIRKCLKDYIENYNGAAWGQQGPDLMTRMLKKWCETDNLDNFLNRQCKGILYLSSNWFYPVPYTDWERYFEPDTWEGNSKEIEHEFSKTRGVHVWNFLSGGQNNHFKGSRSLMEYFFSKYCPRTYNFLPD